VRYIGKIPQFGLAELLGFGFFDLRNIQLLIQADPVGEKPIQGKKQKNQQSKIQQAGPPTQIQGGLFYDFQTDKSFAPTTVFVGCHKHEIVLALL
jgi:hypothetical protein